MRKSKAFTLMELLVIIGLIAVLATVTIVLFNPWTLVGKAYDVKRKHELAQLQKAIEDYYNDKGCYPKPSEICYDVPPPPTNTFGSGAGCSKPLEGQACHICGNESSSPPFSPYLSKLPCDPQHKNKQYLYEVAAASGLNMCTATEANSTSSCPQWYRVYSDLSVQSDPSIGELGCQAGGCGIAPVFGYEYGVTSPNEKLKKTSIYYCYTKMSLSCDNMSPSTYEVLKANPNCVIIYSSLASCCLFQPKPASCP